MIERPLKLLLIEDDDDFARVFLLQLKQICQSRFETFHMSRLSAGLDFISLERPDIAILDLSLPDSDGPLAVSALLERCPQLPIIVLTGSDDEKLALEAIRLGAQEYLVKGSVDAAFIEKMLTYSIEKMKIQEALKQQRVEQQIIFNSVPAMIWYKDRHNRILKLNEFAAQSMNKTIEEMEGQLVDDFFPEEAGKWHQVDLDVIFCGKPKLGLEESYTSPSGEKRWLRTDRIPYLDEQGTAIGVIVFAVDITERKKNEDDLKEREKILLKHNKVLMDLAKSEAMQDGDLKAILREITESVAETLEVERVAIWLYNQDRSRVYCADLYELMADKHHSGMEMAPERFPRYFEILENSRFVASQNAHLEKKLREFTQNYLYPRGITSVLDAAVRLRGRTVGAVCLEHVGPSRVWTAEEKNFTASMADVAALAIESCERKRAEDRINHLAYYDLLTDLPNRVLFVDRLNQAMITARRGKRELAVMVLDLDQFKRINDTLGHAVGDELIQMVANRLRKVLRDSDTLTRIGGDEFAMLFPDFESSGEAIKTADHLMECLREPFRVGDHELFMTGSLGIAIFPNDGLDSVTLLKNADTAMYQAKDKGRNNYRLYSAAMSVKAFEHLILENSLRRAVEKEELKIYYQPQIDIKTGKVLAVEALLRWIHPNLGIVGPSEFIPIAEQTGLIVPIGEWVLRESCRQLKKWHDEGYQKISVAVNLSDRQFNSGNLASLVEQILTETKLEPEYLELELTESMIMKNIGETIETLMRLKKMGVRISIDDFGTGHSSLNYLKRFPIDCLKIDQSFIHDIANNPEDAAIAKAIISMAHNLKLRVIAEGVESDEQLVFLKLHQCDMMQGYSFSKAVAAEDVIKCFVREAVAPKDQSSSVA